MIKPPATALGTPIEDNGEKLDLHDLLTQIGNESSAALSSAIERVNTLAHTGRIDRAGIRSLREELERARRTAMLGQQISRIGSSRVKVYEEKIDVTSLLNDSLMQRAREFTAKGIELRQQLSPVTVVSDVTVVFAMLGALVDWSLENAHTRLEVALEVKTWPAHGHITCTFNQAPEDATGTAATAAANSSSHSMSWRLIETCARKLQLSLERHHTAGRLVVEIGFPKTVMTSQTMDTLLDMSMDDAPSTHNSRPLAGSHLLVLSARRELRVEIREAVLSMGLMIDFVGNVDEAREFCGTGLPHAVVFEASQGGIAMQRLMAELRAGTPGIVFIEIAESGKPFQVNNVGGYELSCVARPSLRDALPTALTFELSRGG